MEDAIDVILQERSPVIPQTKGNSLILTASTGALLTGFYSIWTMFALPGFRKIPINLKVPYLPSSKTQTANVMRLLGGRSGCLADLGSGDGRLVFAASSAGFQCTGFEINPMLMFYSKGKARWARLLPSQATFVNTDFWKADLSKYNNITVFLAPGVNLIDDQMDVLGEKLLRELSDDACVVACRFPFPHWPCHSSAGTDLDNTWAYDIGSVRSSLGKSQ